MRMSRALGLTPDEVRAVADACDAGTFEGRRDAMMVMLMFNTGFRVTETVELRASVSGTMIFPRCGKHIFLQAVTRFS